MTTEQTYTLTQAQREAVQNVSCQLDALCSLLGESDDGKSLHVMSLLEAIKTQALAIHDELPRVTSSKVEEKNSPKADESRHEKEEEVTDWHMLDAIDYVLQARDWLGPSRRVMCRAVQIGRKYTANHAGRPKEREHHEAVANAVLAKLDEVEAVIGGNDEAVTT